MPECSTWSAYYETITNFSLDVDVGYGKLGKTLLERHPFTPSKSFLAAYIARSCNISEIREREGE